MVKIVQNKDRGAVQVLNPVRQSPKEYWQVRHGGFCIRRCHIVWRWVMAIILALYMVWGYFYPYIFTKTVRAVQNANYMTSLLDTDVNPSFLPVINDIEDESADESFSACILWMDDNHRLEEWLAYHYYLLKLRYVVLNVDPWSKTSPQAIVDRWSDHGGKINLNMTIVTMKDSEYIKNYDAEMARIQKAKLSPKTSDPEYEYGFAKTNYHRMRQPQFYKACSKHLIQQNKSWTSYHDTDEFLTFNHKANAGSYRKMNQPGYVLHRLNSIKDQLPPGTDANETGASCLIVNRRRYCAKELSTEETNDLFLPSFNSTTSGMIPTGFMNNGIHSSTDDHQRAIVRRFDTLRYKYLTPGTNGRPKSFIDLSQQNTKLYAQDQWDRSNPKSQAWTTHLPMKNLCKKEKHNRRPKFKTMINEERFLIGHYLGSLDSYGFRDDARKGGIRSYDIWKKRANLTNNEVSHAVRPWLRGFVELVGGPDVASHLLQDAGKFPVDYNVSRIKENYHTIYDYNKDKKNETKIE